MYLQVEKVGDVFCVVLPTQIVGALGITEGATVEVLRVEKDASLAEVRQDASQGDAGSALSDAGSALSVAEAMEAFEATRKQHEWTYRELAK